jgi:hypothetical protein
MEIKFEVSDKGQCLTPCPNWASELGYIANVGANHCSKCPFNKGLDYEKQTVECDLK